MLVGMKMGTAIMEMGMEVPQKVKKKTTIRSSNPTSGYTPKRNENGIWQRYLHCFVLYSIAYNSQDRETT